MSRDDFGMDLGGNYRPSESDRQLEEYSRSIRESGSADRIAALEKENAALQSELSALKSRVEGAQKFSVSRLKKSGEICLVANFFEQDPAAWEDVTIHAVPVEKL